MRILIIIVALLLAQPALAAGPSVYHNKKFGVEVTVPPGFIAAGVPGPEGQTFRSRSGLAELRVFGQVIPNKDFTSYVKKAMAFDKSYYGWTMRGSTITPSWAEYKGAHGARQLRVRIITSCKGRHALTAWIDYNGQMDREVSQLFASLKAGPASSCPN